MNFLARSADKEWEAVRHIPGPALVLDIFGRSPTKTPAWEVPRTCWFRSRSVSDVRTNGNFSQGGFPRKQY